MVGSSSSSGCSSGGSGRVVVALGRSSRLSMSCLRHWQARRCLQKLKVFKKACRDASSPVFTKPPEESGKKNAISSIECALPGRRVSKVGVKNGWVTVCVNAQVTSDYAIVATICAAAHSTNISCARALNVLKFLGFRLSCFRGPDGRISSLRLSALRGVKHVTICTFQFRRPNHVRSALNFARAVVHLLFFI